MPYPSTVVEQDVLKSVLRVLLESLEMLNIMQIKSKINQVSANHCKVNMLVVSNDELMGFLCKSSIFLTCIVARLTKKCVSNRYALLNRRQMVPRGN